MIVAVTFWSGGRATKLETAGIVLITCAIFFAFISGHPFDAFLFTPMANIQNALLPFGAVIFALAGWTSVEQVYEIRKKAAYSRWGAPPFCFRHDVRGHSLLAFRAWDIGVVTARCHGHHFRHRGWPFWKRDILALIGLLAISIVSIPLVRELRGALEKDLRWNSFISQIVIVGVPLSVVLSGFNNFLIIVGLAGGIFISTQYLLIIAVGRKTLLFLAAKKSFSTFSP